MAEFSLSCMDRLIREVGNDRVSESAAFELRAIVESLGEEIAEEAIRNAKREGIETIKRDHIREAVNEVDVDTY